MVQSTSPRAGFAERYLEGSPRARSSGRGSLSPRQPSLPKTVPTGRAAPDSQVPCHSSDMSSATAAHAHMVAHGPVGSVQDRQLVCLMMLLSRCSYIIFSAMQVYHQGTSQFKGVSWAERSKKWRAQLWFGNKVHLSPAMPCVVAAAMHGSSRRCGRHALPQFGQSVGNICRTALCITAAACYRSALM